MKLITHKSVQEEHEIELPHYRVSGNHFFRIISEERSVMVHLGWDKQGNGCSVGNCFTGTAFNGTSESNEEDFNKAFNTTFSKLIKQVK